MCRSAVDHLNLQEVLNALVLPAPERTARPESAPIRPGRCRPSFQVLFGLPTPSTDPPLTAWSLPPTHLDLCLSPAVQREYSQLPASGPWPVRPWASLHLSILSNSPTLSTLRDQVPGQVLWYCDCARPLGAAQAQIP